MSQTETEMDPAERDKVMSKCYGQAQTTLRERHRDEFNSLYQKYLADVGIEWTPKPTPEQLALEQIVKLLRDYPTLSEKLAERLSASEQAGAQADPQANGKAAQIDAGGF